MKDPQIAAVIRQLFAGEKPKDIKPADLLLTIRLLVQQADEKEVHLSQGTLATDLSCSEKSIQRSAELLAKRNWITVKHRGHRALPNLYAIQLDNLPLGELRRTIVGEWAKQFALRYKNWMLKVNPKQRFARTAFQRFAFVLQAIVDKKCGGDSKLAEEVISFATAHHQKEAMKGPHRLRRYWRSIVEEMQKEKIGQKAIDEALDEEMTEPSGAVV